MLFQCFVKGKIWKHEVVYDILHRGLPKYELVQATMHGRVVNALFLMDNDTRNDHDDDDEDDGSSIVVPAEPTNPTLTGEEATANKQVPGGNPFLPSNAVVGAMGRNTSGAANGTVATSVSLSQSSRQQSRRPTLTPQPTIGKKKGKDNGSASGSSEEPEDGKDGCAR